MDLFVLVLIVCSLTKDGSPIHVDDCQHAIVRTLYSGDDAKRDCDNRLRELILKGDELGKSVVGSCQEVHLPAEK